MRRSSSSSIGSSIGAPSAVVTFASFAAIGALLCSCTAILGIEDLKDTKPVSGDGGPSGTGGATSGSGGTGASGASSGGTSASSGGTAATTGGATSGSGGSPASGGSSGSATGGGPASGGTSGSGGVTGTGGATGTDAGTPDGGGGTSGAVVHGKIVDYFMNPIPNAAVSVGTESAVSDASGAFTIDAPATYDLAFTITTTVSNTPANIGWLFQGLTRRDPTLQIYNGTQSRNTDVNFNVTGVTFPLAATQSLAVDIAVKNGEDNLTLDVPMTDYGPVQWTGPASTQGFAHALLWTFSGAQSLPTKYTQTDSHAVTLTEGTPPTVSFALGTTVLDPGPGSGTLKGTVSSPTTTNRENDVFVRFTDNAAIQVVKDGAPAASYSYVVPSITGATITVAAATGDSFLTPYAVVHQDGLAMGQTAPLMTIPTAPSLVGPVDSATATSSTTFKWSGTPNVYVFTVNFTQTYDVMHIVTTKTQAPLPSFAASSFTIPPGTDCTWFVETHGTYATVDAATTSSGFLDSMAYGMVRGPRRGTGSYTDSETRSFTTSM